jgi:hypothetical protein
MRYVFGATILLVAGFPAGADDAKARKDAGLDPKVCDIVKQVGKLYQGAKAFHAEGTLASTVQNGDDKRETKIAATYDFEKPNRLSLRSRHGDDANAGLEVVYDGKTLTIHARRMKRYTEGPAPEDVAALGRKLQQVGHVATGMLIQNLLAEDPGALLMEGVTECSYAGTEKVDGQPAHHLKFKQPEFDWELWVAADGPPLVLRMGSVQATDGGKVVTVEDYRNWKLDGTLAKDALRFTAPPDAKKVPSLADRPSDG